MQLDTLLKRQVMRRIDGVSFPIFIRNGPTYFLSDLLVFEDGLVDCWHTHDLPMFLDDVTSGWVQPGVPDGAFINLQEYTRLEVKDPQWEMTADDLVLRVEEIVTALNPGRVNMYDMQGSSLVEGTRILKESRSRAELWKPEADSFFRDRHKGAAVFGYRPNGDVLEIVEVSVYADDTVTVTGVDGVQSQSFDGFIDDLRAGAFSVPHTGQRLAIKGLGQFTAGEVVLHGYTSETLIGDVTERHRKVSGLPTSYETCRAVFAAYCDDPTDETLARLRDAYESVPPHLRKYCGDMDNKDIPIRMALYGDEEIEGWSHWIAANLTGDPLPDIDVPKPKS